MTQLCDLPADVLQAICVRHEALILWRCGSKRLNAKLANSVTFIRLVDESLLNWPRHFPNLDCFPKLQDLHISSALNSHWSSQEIIGAVKRLPSSLERLRLRLTDCHSCFALSVQSSLSQRASPASKGSFEPLRWKTAFPGLRTLILEDVQQTTHWTTADLDELPSSLTRLSVPATIFRLPTSYSHLPKGLQMLDLERHMIFLAWTPELCEALPGTLTALASSGPGPAINYNFLAHLPTSMTSLNVNLPEPTTDREDGDVGDSSAKIGSLIHRFKDLRTLSMSGGQAFSADRANVDTPFTTSWLQSLPRSLTELSLPQTEDFADASAVLRVSDMKHLPQSLVQLTTAKLVYDSDTTRQWPEVEDASTAQQKAILPRLAHLTVSSEIDSAAIVPLLPRSLTHLWISHPGRNWTTLICTSIAQPLPPNLQFLNWRVEFSQPGTSAEGTIPIGMPVAGPSHLFPRSLTEMAIKSNAVWTSQAVAGLPRTLTHLTLHEALLTEESCADLPPGLRELSVFEFAKSNDVYALRRRPSPRRQPLAAFKDISDSWWQWHYRDHDWDHSDEIEDSPSLQSSDQEGLVGNPKRLLRDVSLRLPETLTGLHIMQSLHYTSNLTATLPSGLRLLEIPFLDVSDPEDMHRLPKTLKKLRARFEGKKSKESLAALPSSITDLADLNAMPNHYYSHANNGITAMDLFGDDH